MNTDFLNQNLRNNAEKILDCHTKDPDGLNDFQKLPDEGAKAIDRVGIERFRLPLLLKTTDGQLRSHDGNASMFVSLQEGKTGVNMSRFCQILQEEAEENPVTKTFLQNVTKKFSERLRDFDHEEPIPIAELQLKFQYPVKQISLKSDYWGWQYYNVELLGKRMKGEFFHSLTLYYEYSSTCPCSLSMAKQYEADFRQGKTTEGQGIASAHSQRSLATITVDIQPTSDFFIEDLIELARIALPTETQSLVKRADEQAFAILNGENPMFVEHAIRRLAFLLDETTAITSWKAKVEHFESLHSHNAVAYMESAPQA